MLFRAALTVQFEGQTSEVVTDVSLDEVCARGVRWLPAVVERLPPKGPATMAAATLVNVANVCEAKGLPVDGLGALRLARRMSPDLLPYLTPLIQEREPRGRFQPQGLPAGLEFVHHRDDPSTFRQMLGAPAEAGFSYPGLMYQAYVQGSLGHADADSTPFALENLSFHVLRKGRRVATVPCWVRRDGPLTWANDTPVTLHCAEPRDAAALTGPVLQYLQHLVRAWGCSSLVMREPDVQQFTLQRQLSAQMDYSAELHTLPYIDLTRSEAEIHKAIRKSYKSQINWCREHLQTTYHAGRAITQELIDDGYVRLQEFHADNIRKHGDGMPAKLYLHFVRECLSGRGEIAVTRWQDRICGITMSVDDQHDTYYAQAGSELVDGGRTPGCYIVLDAALRARARGQRRYLMDRYTPPPLTVDWPGVRSASDFARALGFFKRGFSDDRELAFVYKILPARTRLAAGPGATDTTPA